MEHIQISHSPQNAANIARGAQTNGAAPAKGYTVNNCLRHSQACLTSIAETFQQPERSSGQ